MRVADFPKFLERRFHSLIPDDELLRRFLQSRDESAFRDIVNRHGPMVLQLCRRRLGDTHAAEDAFQATFLILSRKAGSIRRPEALAAWLYGVAHRISNKARLAIARRRRAETRSVKLPAAHYQEQIAANEILDVLDNELHRLPERYRLPLWLCFWQGLTQDQAARKLGWTPGSVKGRVERGRKLLAARLTKRGIAPTVLLAVTLTPTVVPGELIASTSLIAASGAIVPASVLALTATGVTTKALGSAMVVLLAGAGLVGLSGGFASPQTPGTKAPTRDAPQLIPKPELDEEPLPNGVVARLGSTRLRHIGLADFVLAPDNASAMTIGADRVLRTWNLNSGRQTRAVPLQIEGAPKTFVPAISPDGKTVAACDGTDVSFWEVATGRLLKSQPMPLAEKDLAFLWFSPDGRLLAIGSWEPRATILDWRAGTERIVPLPARQHGRDSTFHAYFTPDGKHFVAGGGAESALTVFDTKSWNETQRLFCQARVSTVTPDGKTLIVLSSPPGGGDASNMRLFDLATGKETASHALDDYHFSLAVSPDAKSIACGLSDGSCIIDLATGRVRYRLTGRPLEMAFTSDSKTLVALSGGNSLRLWDVATGKEKHERPPELGRPLTMAVSLDGRMLATAAWLDTRVTMWDLVDGRVVGSLAVGGVGRYVRSLAFNESGHELIGAEYKGHIQFWEPATGRERKTLKLQDSERPAQSPIGFYRLHVHADGLQVTTIAPTFIDLEATRLASWDPKTGTLIRQLMLPKERTNWSWAGDESAFVVPLPDGLAVYEGQGLTLRHKISDGSPRWPVVVSASGRLVAASMLDGEQFRVGIWDMDTGKSVTKLATGKVEYLALGADDRTLVGASESRLIVWDLARDRERKRWVLPAAPVGLILSPDGRRAVTALRDGTGLVWDLAALASEGLAGTASTDDLAKWWTDLASPNSLIAHQAVWKLSDAPANAVLPLLERHMQPAPLDAQSIQKLVGELDSESFAVRQAATAKLKNMGGTAVPSLVSARKVAQSAEVHKRLDVLIEQLSTRNADPSALRRLRAIGILARFDTPESRRLLVELANGNVTAHESRTAKAALARLPAREK